MPTITSRAAVKIPAALLLGLLTVVSGAAEQHSVQATNSTYNRRSEGDGGQSKGQLCLVGSRNCLSMGRHPARPCLLAPDQCDGSPGRLEPLKLAR